MPKKSLFPHTNQIFELETQDFQFSISHKFCTIIGKQSEILHYLVDVVRNRAVCD